MSPLIHPRLSRRRFLRASGVSLALPFLDAMLPRGLSADPPPAPRRLIGVCAVLGLHAPCFFPTATGRSYESPPYLALLNDHREDFTVFSGFSHEGNEAAGHLSEVTFLTAARNPQLTGFRNSVSLDQFIAGRIGDWTRFPSITLATAPSRAKSLAVNPSGTNLPADTRPSTVFARLFLDGTPDEVDRETARLAEGRSVLDAVTDQAKRLETEVGSGDRDKLEEYFNSVREMERRLQAMQSWAARPKPKVGVPPPTEVTNAADQIARIRAMFELMPLALQTDSTRIITLLIGPSNVPMPLPGVTLGHHTLSHHGQAPAKIEQLRTVEEAELKAFAGLLARLKSAREGSSSLLANTSVLLGSNLGNANNHTTGNLPILLAGGGFKHGRHLAVAGAGAKNQSVPLSNLFVSIAERMGVVTGRFGGSTGALTALESA